MPSPILPISNPPKQLRPPPAMLPLIASKHDDDPVSSLLISSYDDEKLLMDRPLLPRTSSFTYSSAADSSTPAVNGGGGYSNCKQYQQRRRRVNSESCLSSLTSNGRCGNGELIGDEVEDAAKEMRLSLKLFRFLGLGYRFAKRFIALGCYSMLLWPGFIQVGYYYFFSNQVRRGIDYGSQPRNRLDLYLPKDMDGPKPVIAFITGGAWIIGYKAWGSLLGQQLTERGIIVACIDYRNYPQGTISDMITDASQGISFVCNNISEYGGDPNRIYVMGQSAGAHIAACTLLEQAIKESSEEQSCSWRLSQVKAYFGLSGGYNLLNLVDHFDNRGLYRSIFLGIMEGEESLRRYSPELMAQDPNIRSAVTRLPPFVLFHGTADYSIPSNASKDFAESLQRAGVKAEAMLYEGKTHTDLFLQDPMRGGKDDMVEELVSRIHGDVEEALKKEAVAPSRRRMVPEFMLKLARAVSPF